MNSEAGESGLVLYGGWVALLVSDDYGTDVAR